MPSSETILNRSLHVLFCFFLSDDLNYLIITIGCLHWKMNCFGHRRNFSPSSSLSESLPLQWQHRADSPSQLGTGSSRAVHVGSELPARLSQGNPLVLPWPRWRARILMGLSATLLHSCCRKCHQSLNLARSSDELLSDV